MAFLSSSFDRSGSVDRSLVSPTVSDPERNDSGRDVRIANK
jgi:hypothetical protein